MLLASFGDDAPTAQRFFRRMPRLASSLLTALATTTTFAAPARVIVAQQTTDSAGVRIYDYRRQTSSPVAFLAADTPFVRVQSVGHRRVWRNGGRATSKLLFCCRHFA